MDEHLNPHGKPGPQRLPRKQSTTFALFLGAAIFVGSPVGLPESAFARPYEPKNVHREGRTLPSDLRRVLVLPMTGDKSYAQTESREFLYQILLEELGKTGEFEVSPADPALLKAKTGKAVWQAEDALPESFLDNVGKTFACNGILFCHLTTYRPYAPQSVGWRLKLVDARDGTILWAADEVFDAGRPAVVAGVKKFDRNEQNTKPDNGAWATIHSPRRFARYSLATLLDLLPRR
jgi:hypothetical protein